MQKRAYSYIRFSSPEQLKGDSLRRQLEASRAYAKEHDLVLDESLRDLGVSAFRGKNRTEGALKKFIELVEAGRVEKGSILILESLDRLSRQQVFSALSLFSSLLSAGVEIVTLSDGQHYTIDSVNDVGQLMFSLISMSRSHEESAMKSKRSAASWESRRKRAEESKKPITALSPHWLRLSDDKQRFEIIEEYAVIVRSIFTQSIAGLGRRTIAAKLNASKVKPFGKAKMWHTSYIARVLGSRSAMGEYQPCQGGAPIGKAIKGYYPAIISEQVFFQAQDSQKSRWRNNSGRKGLKFSNLFTGMCKCLECGGTYRLMSRGKHALLLCDSHYMSAGCECDKRWLYDDVENAALIALSEHVDWFSVYGGLSDSRQELENEIKALNGKLTDTKKKVSRFAELFALADDTSFSDARSRYTEAMKEADQLQLAIDNKEVELRTYTPTQQHVDRLSAALFDLRYKEKEDAELYELRAQINAAFRDAGLRLYFFEAGVVYEISSTGETGIILTEENKEDMALLAHAEIINHSIKAVKDVLLQAQE